MLGLYPSPSNPNISLCDTLLSHVNLYAYRFTCESRVSQSDNLTLLKSERWKQVSPTRNLLRDLRDLHQGVSLLI